VLIINHGKLVVEAPLAQLTSRAGGSVRVRTRDPALLGDALERAGIRAVAGNDHTLLAYGTTSEQVGDIAFAANVAIHELTGESSSLEEVFLGLTSEAA
jgi:ABC-2 type transport system ATP-binding protein